jgi:hypothetical protein
MTFNTIPDSFSQWVQPHPVQHTPIQIDLNTRINLFEKVDRISLPTF